jgi:Ca2+/H+ antiporter
MNTCDDLHVDWNPTISAEAYSALAAVLTGFVFTGMMFIITERGREGTNKDRRTQTLLLFLSAFLVFAYDSYLYALASGELACARAWSITIIASGFLGLGAVSIFAGLAWLLDTYLRDNDNEHRVKTLTTNIVVGIAITVAVLLPVTVSGYWADVFEPDLPRWVPALLLAYSLFIIAALIGARMRWQRSPTRTTSREDRALHFSVNATVIYTIASVVANGLIINIPGSQWNPIPNRWLPIALGIVSMIVPTLILVVQISGLPKSSTPAPIRSPG